MITGQVMVSINRRWPMKRMVALVVILVAIGVGLAWTRGVYDGRVHFTQTIEATRLTKVQQVEDLFLSLVRDNSEWRTKKKIGNVAHSVEARVEEVQAAYDKAKRGIQNSLWH